METFLRINGCWALEDVMTVGFSGEKSSLRLFLFAWGVPSGEENPDVESWSLSGEATWNLAKRFLRAAAMRDAASPGGGVRGRSLIGVPPGDLETKWPRKNQIRGIEKPNNGLQSVKWNARHESFIIAMTAESFCNNGS